MSLPFCLVGIGVPDKVLGLFPLGSVGDFV